jgi:hypothetical protein
LHASEAENFAHAMLVLGVDRGFDRVVPEL